MRTSTKGDIGTAKAIADLTVKGYSVLMPMSSDLPFDLVAYKDGTFLKLQAKYSSKGKLSSTRAFFIKGKACTRLYKVEEFDYYCLYLPDIDKVVYPASKFMGSCIRSTVPDAPCRFYWWEDFTDFTSMADRKTRKDFGHVPEYKPRINARKAERPTKEVLSDMLWKMPTTEIAKQFDVTDKAISKWASSLELPKPPRGFWSMSEEAKKGIEQITKNLEKFSKSAHNIKISTMSDDLKRSIELIGMPKEVEFCKALSANCKADVLQ